MRRVAAAGVAAALAVASPHPAHAFDLGGLLGGGGGGGIGCIGRDGGGGLLDMAKDAVKGAIRTVVPSIGGMAAEALDAGEDGACEIVETEPGATQAEIMEANRWLETAMTGSVFDDPAQLAEVAGKLGIEMLRRHAGTSSEEASEAVYREVYAPAMPESMTAEEAAVYVGEAERDRAAALHARRMAVAAHSEELERLGEALSATSREAMAAEGIRGAVQVGVQAELAGVDVERRVLEVALHQANVAQAEADADMLGRELARRTIKEITAFQ